MCVYKQLFVTKYSHSKNVQSSSALHPKSLELCQIATIDVHIDDVNDFSPKFEKSTYTFYTDEYPYNNTEIGSVMARDEDKVGFLSLIGNM
jgi:hypothetical protein